METYSERHRVGFEMAINKIKEALTELRLKKRTNMTADYAWALDDIDVLIEKVSNE